jgi:hypothetical protein
MKVQTEIIDQEKFAQETAIIVPLIALIVKEQEHPSLSEEDWNWFRHHADVRVRYLYSSNKSWKRVLKGNGDKGRDRVYMFVQHWLKAYVQNPARYQSRHPHDVFDFKDDVYAAS